ncbi:type VI secretion system lipoprotein TssJ [Limnobaculum parvum]|nr:type VI secretion system lipoprotein TssJ [Limnobaculum parvum]
MTMKQQKKNKSVAVLAVGMMLLGGLLTGCGLMQTAMDGTVSVAKAIFIKDINVLHLDFAARAELNPGDGGVPASLVIRTYQLGKKENFEKATYQDLLENDEKVLGADFISRDDVVLTPSSAIALDSSMHKEAAFVGVVALFRTPNLDDNSWRVLIERNDLEADKPRLLVANYAEIGLVPVK